MDHSLSPANALPVMAGGSLAATAFVLAGGESSRMGSDKALLALPSGETMLRRALVTARQVAGTVMLVAPEERYPELRGELRIIADVYPGRGPLAGIHAALRASETEWNLVLGVDTPRVTPELLRFLLASAAGTGAPAGVLALVPRVEGRLHTVCAVYRKAFAEAAERALIDDRQPAKAMSPEFGSRRQDGPKPRRGTRIERLLAEVPSRILEENELRQAGFGVELFANVNTPQDFAALDSGKRRSSG